MVNKEEMSEEEQIGFHKGALSVLSKEREEMTRILQVVEQLMQAHIEGLEEKGINLDEISQENTENEKQPIEDIIQEESE